MQHILITGGSGYLGAELVQQAGSLGTYRVSATYHSHPHTQVDYLLEGEIDMQVGDEVRRMHAGDIVQVPGNVPHAFCRVYRDTRWLEFFTPAREDILPREEQKEKE